jgi:isopropylmalate/homocitrate/citramalate synthase
MAGELNVQALARGGLDGTPVTLVDITLRDGMQAANVALTRAQRIEVAERLDDAGVEVIQVGFAGADEELAAEIKSRVRASVNMLLLGFHPDAEEHLRRAAGAGIDVLEILVRSGERQLATMGLDPGVAISLSGRLCEAAVEAFPDVWFCPSFAPVSRREVLDEMLATVFAAGVSHFNIPDSSGVAAPAEMAALVERFAGRPGWTVGVHTHNDFGLAVANALAAIAAGARAADVTVNGYGERAGNCSLEQLAAALEQLFGASTSLDITKLHDLSRDVALRVGRAIAPDAPIVGRDAFAQKLDAHVRLTDLDPTLLEGLDPATVGNTRRLAVGPGSGTYSLTRKLESLGVEGPDSDAVAVALPRIVAIVEERKEIEDDAIVAVYEEALAGSGTTESSSASANP